MMVQLVLVSVSVYLRPAAGVSSDYQQSGSRRVARHCFEVATLTGCCYYLLGQTGSEIRNQGFVPFIIQLCHDPVQLVFNLSNLCLLACVPLRVLQQGAAEEMVITMATPGYWLYLMFFAGAVQLTGPFVTMIFKIITNDMVTFFIIYSVFLLAFTQAFYFLYKGVAGSRFDTYIDTWMGLFQMTLGDYDFAELFRSQYPGMLLMTFVLFMVLMPILLLNMLIAMMGNTYATVVQQSEKEWVKQWANIVITLERGLGREKCKAAMESYSLQLPGGAKRGVMVIKTKAKTRARQRKGALTNWKKVGITTLRTLRRRRMTGEQLRREMWGLDSASSTPMKKKKMTRYSVAAETVECLAGPGENISSALENLSSVPLVQHRPKLPPITTTAKTDVPASIDEMKPHDISVSSNVISSENISSNVNGSLNGAVSNLSESSCTVQEGSATSVSEEVSRLVILPRPGFSSNRVHPAANDHIEMTTKTPKV